MPGEDAGGDVQQRCMSLRGQPDDWGAARSGEAGCRAGRRPQQAPPGAARMSSYLREGPLRAHVGAMPASRGAVLLLHGQPGGARDWERVIAALKPGTIAIAI